MPNTERLRPILHSPNVTWAAYFLGSGKDFEWNSAEVVCSKYYTASHSCRFVQLERLARSVINLDTMRNLVVESGSRSRAARIE